MVKRRLGMEKILLRSIANFSRTVIGIPEKINGKTNIQGQIQDN